MSGIRMPRVWPPAEDVVKKLLGRVSITQGTGSDTGGAIHADGMTVTHVQTDVHELHVPHLHFIGICGKGMGALALALSRAGWPITGSDEGTYPPMNELLKAGGLNVMTPYDAANIPSAVELVVVGKRVRENNPELRHALAQGLPYCSFPALLRSFFLNRSRNAVIAGGLGKTTTTAMLAWILEHEGRSPDYLIGGLARNFELPARFVGADFTVLEGDEYASCFDDSQPKFMHYNPEIVIITNVVEDHPDLYSEMDDVEKAFGRLVHSLPRSGCLVIPDDDVAANRIASACACPVLRVGFSTQADFRITDLDLCAGESRFDLTTPTSSCRSVAE